MNENSFVWTERDKTAVLHYIIYGNTSQAYKNAMHGEYKGKSNNLYNIANRYFNSEKIKVLLNVEIQRFRDNSESIFKRVGMKNPITSNIVTKDKQTAEDLEKLADIDKNKAIQIIQTTINSNPTDSKTIKELMPLLTKLNQWDKEQTTVKSNITLYELPKKSTC